MDGAWSSLGQQNVSLPMARVALGEFKVPSNLNQSLISEGEGFQAPTEGNLAPPGLKLQAEAGQETGTTPGKTSKIQRCVWEYHWAALDQTELENRSSPGPEDLGLTYHRNEQLLLTNLGSLPELQVEGLCMDIKLSGEFWEWDWTGNMGTGEGRCCSGVFSSHF